MAEQEPAAGSNGSGEGMMEPQISIIAQYTKDLSVENPSAPQVFQWQTQPTLDVQFNIGVENVGEDVQEVTLKIEVSARSESGVHFVVDLSYAGLFGLRNVPQEALPAFLLIEAPRLIFPFARQIIAESVTGAGFPPVMLDPIDFAAAYMAQAQAQQEGGAGGELPGTAEGEPDPSQA